MKQQVKLEAFENHNRMLQQLSVGGHNKWTPALLVLVIVVFISARLM
jgi:hypothetical protein